MKPKITLNAPKNIENNIKDESFRLVLNEKSDEIELLLYGVIGDDWEGLDAGTVVKSLAAAGNKPLTVRINSFGGLAYDGLAIHNAIAGYKGPTTAIIESVAASAASLAAIGADKVQMQANATYQIHEGLTFAFGHIADLKDTINWLEAFNAAAADTYAAKSGQTVEFMRAALLGENGDGTIYNAEQALDAGFIDEILPLTSKAKKPAKNMSVAAMQRALNYRIVRSELTRRRE